MKYKVKALADQHFKATVTANFPTDKIDDAGKTIYDSLKFVGLFRCIPVSQAHAHMRELNDLRKADDHLGAVELGAQQATKTFIGFEAVKDEELPFVDDQGEPIVSSPEAIAMLLESREIRLAVQEAYQRAREGDTNGKNSKQ